jgi:23S rRNA (adenine2503-C2)-methyltransferase
LKDLRRMELNELEAYFESIGEKKFRAKQVFKWVQSGVETFEGMSDISKVLREKLERDFTLKNMEIIEVLKSEDGTRKYLLEMSDGSVIESVLMKYEYGYSICISTQVGCRMGCSFCASTLDGMDRNMTAGEMIGEILTVQNDIRKNGEPEARIGRVVLMGSGEPLDNFDEVIKFLRLVNHDSGLNISHRSITISTCGIVPKIYELADMKLQITLAVSLHAYADDVRSSLMPINRKYKIADLIEACKYYQNTTKRRITFEYALIAGQNDTETGARKLGSLLRGNGFHVNLIPVNMVVERGFLPTKTSGISKFASILKGYGIETTIRRELGSDISAACGQLRKKHMDKEK